MVLGPGNYGAEPGSGPGSVIVTLSGKQSPGALADVMRVLGTDETATLVDFGQLVVRRRFTATALILCPVAQDVIKGVLLRAHESGIHVDFSVSSDLSAGGVGPHSVSSLSSLKETTEEYVLTVFSPGRVPAPFLADVTRVLLMNNAHVVGINRLTEDGDDFMCLEMIVTLDTRDEGSFLLLQHQLFELGRREESSDIALQRGNVSRKAKRMVVFDLSWTLVQCDAVDVVLRAAGKEANKEDADAWAAGTMSGPDWLRARVARLKGTNADDVNKKVLAELKYTHGAIELCKGLKRLGCRLAVVSSASKFIAEAARETLGLDYAFGNLFESDSRNRFTGLVKGPIVDTERKAELVQMLAMQERIHVEQIVAVGDGPVSSKMLSVAGMSIAFDQPDATNEVHSGRIASKSLASVLYLLGVTGYDFRRVAAS